MPENIFPSLCLREKIEILANKTAAHNTQKKRFFLFTTFQQDTKLYQHPNKTSEIGPMISVLLSFWQFKINVLSFHSGNNAKLECANLFSVHTQKEKFSFFWSLFLCSWRMDGVAHVPAEKQQQLVIYLNNTNLFFSCNRIFPIFPTKQQEENIFL